MGMLLYMEELKRKEREAQMAAEAQETPTEPALEPKVDKPTKEAEKPVKKPGRPVKRQTGKRAAK